MDILQRLLPFLLPKPGKKARAPQQQPAARNVAHGGVSMELMPAANRMQLGDALIKQPKEDYVLWCLSRLGAQAVVLRPCKPGSLGRRGDALD